MWRNHVLARKHRNARCGPFQQVSLSRKQGRHTTVMSSIRQVIAAMRPNRQTARTRVNKGRSRRAAGSKFSARPSSAHKRRGAGLASGPQFDAPEVWHEPRGDGQLEFIVQPPGSEYIHPVSTEEICERIGELPREFQRGVEYVQLSRSTRKRQLFPCYGLQWGTTIYLYPIEENLEELYIRAPRPQQRIETEMFGGRWVQDNSFWWLIWTEHTIRDYYLNNVLIHEIGHINDTRNRRFIDRERFADWFAIEYGYRASRRRYRASRRRYRRSRG